MTEGALNVPAGLIIRELRRDPTLAPGGGRFPEVVRRFLPLVYGISSALIPENPAAAETVSTAVFETLTSRWRRISRKTVIATWLVRTTCFAAARERSRLGLKAKAGTAAGLLAQRLFKEVNRLAPRDANAVVLCSFLKEAPENPAAALRTNTGRVEKRNRKAVARLTKGMQKLAIKLRKLGPVELPEMGSIPVATAAEVEERILSRLAGWRSNAEKSSLVRGAVSAWQWRAVARFFKRLAATIGTIICVLVMFGFTMKFLIDHGHVIFLGGMQKQMLQEFPDMGKPAHPWPMTPEEMQYASLKTPSNAVELYGLTNIWLAKLKLTPKQWKGVQPVNVPPAPHLPNGKMALRNPKASRSGLAGAIGIDFHWSEGAFEFAGERFQAVGVRYRGNGTYLNSLFGPKQSYKVDLNRVKQGQEIAGVTTLNFVNSIPDFSYMKDVLAQKLFRELGAVSPRTAYAYLSIDVPGQFTNQALGLYVLIENIDGAFAKDRFGLKSVPIFKPVTYDLFADWGKDWSAYKEIYDLKTKATPEQLSRVTELARLMSHASDEDFARKLPEFLDLEEYAAFVAGHVLTSSYDGYLSTGQNFYMYLDPASNRFGFIPWDQDHGWGEFGYVSKAEKRETASIWKPSAYDNKFLKRVMKVEAFRAVYRRKLEQGLAGPFTVERLNREIDALAAALRPAIAAESEFRLKRFEIAISTNWISGPRDGAMNSGTAEGPRAPAHQLKRFILARTQSVRDQLEGKAEGALISGFGQWTSRRAASARQNARGLPKPAKRGAKQGKTRLSPTHGGIKSPSNEPDAKAILPGPRRVIKANSCRFYFMSNILSEISRTRNITGSFVVMENYDINFRLCRYGIWIGVENTFTETVTVSYEHTNELYVGWRINGVTVVDPGYSAGTPPWGNPVPGIPGVTYHCPVDGFFHRISFASTPGMDKRCFYAQVLYRNGIAEAAMAPHYGPSICVCISGKEIEWPEDKLEEERNCLAAFFEKLRQYKLIAHVNPPDPVEWLQRFQGLEAQMLKAQVDTYEKVNHERQPALAKAVETNIVNTLQAHALGAERIQVKSMQRG